MPPETVAPLLFALPDVDNCRVVGYKICTACRLPSAMTEAPVASTAVDEIDRALRTYINLPECVDLQLNVDGIELHTSDFPKLIVESSGLDLRQYFVDALQGADFLSSVERTKLSRELFEIFSTVTAFTSNEQGAVMHRREQSFIALPEAMSQGFVQQMTIERQVKFALSSPAPDEAAFIAVSGINFNVGGRVLALRELHMKAKGGFCDIKPVFAEKGVIPHRGDLLHRLKAAGKDLLVGVMVHSRKVSTRLPVVVSEFREYLCNAINFRSLLRDQQKDLVMFFERTAGIRIEDPLTKALLLRGNRIVKKNEQIEIARQSETVCDLGGIALMIAPHVQLHVARSTEKLDIEKLVGIGIKVPFESPPELRTIGFDLERSMPHCITSLKLSLRDQLEKRRLVAGTTPGCWIGLDLDANMQPELDSTGNWLVFGVTHNPISGAPQKFFLRLDKQNNLNMTPREIAEVVTQTAIEGFDPNNPTTWTWAALALGGQTFLAAENLLRDATDADKLKKGARQLGRMLGKLLDDL